MANTSSIVRPDLARMLFEVGVVKFGAFRLKRHEKEPDAPLSPYYLNIRTPPKGPLSEDLVKQLVHELFNPVVEREKLPFMAVAGVPEAADPFATVFAESRRVPQIWLEKTASTGGRAVTGVKQGSLVPRGPVLLLDDLVTLAHSKIEAANILRAAGAEVKDVLVFVDREQGGARELVTAGLTLHAIWKLGDLLKFYWHEGHITNEQYVESVAYLATERT